MDLLKKTDRARAALEPGSRLLSPRERTLVLLADGKRSGPDLVDMVKGASPACLQALVDKGYLSVVNLALEQASRTSPKPAVTPEQASSQAIAQRLLDQLRAEQRQMMPPESERQRPEAQAWVNGLDDEPSTLPPLEDLGSAAASALDAPATPGAHRPDLAAPQRRPSGRMKRSAAATKMHLMDLAERTFSRSSPRRAVYFRDMLREIRDDDSLTLAIDIVLEAVAEVAGPERARSMREALLEDNPS